MSKKYKFHNPSGLYFVSFTVQNWVDVFTRHEYKEILVESLAYSQKHKGLELFAWCIMTNHVHLIIRAQDGFLLQDILRDLKTFTSKSVVKAIQENIQESRKEWLLSMLKTDDGYSFWHAGNRPIELWSNAVVSQKLNYLHQNPVNDGVVFQADQYVYSSTIDYAGGKGLLDVIIIE